MSVHLEKVIQPNNILDWFFDCQSSNGLTVFETFLSQGIISLIFFKTDFLAQTVIYISPIETLRKRLQSLGRNNTQRLKRDLSPTFFLCRVLEIWTASLLFDDVYTQPMQKWQNRMRVLMLSQGTWAWPISSPGVSHEYQQQYVVFISCSEFGSEPRNGPFVDPKWHICISKPIT